MRNPIFQLICGLLLATALLAVSCQLPRPPAPTVPPPAITAEPTETAAPTATVSTETPAASATPPPTPTPQPNLLTNPGFEGGTYQSGPDQFIPLSWLPWGRAGCVHVGLQNHPPQVRTGTYAARIYQSFDHCAMGLFQIVDVLPAATYQVQAYGFSWSTNNPTVGTLSEAYVKAWIGIDPDGGTDPASPSIIWSNENAARDVYGFFTVTAVAREGRITVWLKSVPDWALARSDTFWDDVALYEVSKP